MIVESLTSVLEVVPGQPIVGRIRVVNDSSRDANYQVRVVGIDLPTDWRPIGGGAVAAGAEVHVDVPILIPGEIGLGQHPVGIEVVSDHADERSALTSMTVSVESVTGVLLRAEPSVVRGRATGKFRLGLENREPNPVELELVGSGTDIAVSFKPTRVVLQPGERAISKGKLTGKRRWSGDEEQHFVTLTARGRASSQSITTRFVQRSMLPWRFRTLVAAVLVLSLWLAGALVYVWYQNSKTEDAADGTSTEQTSDSDQPGDGSGDGTGDGAATDGDASGSGGSDAEAEADRVKVPTETTFGGAVALADGSDPSDVTVSLDEIPLGQVGEGVVPKGFAAGPDPAKIWSSRYGSGDRPGISSMRQTDTIRSVDTTKDGTWRIPSVALRRNYELVFSRAGYNTQSFVVTPPEDGSPVAIDVELQPAVGAIAGVVRSASGPLGGVTLEATDGDLVFSTTSSTDAGTLGEFSFNGLSTPAVYTVTVTRTGFGTEVVQFDLAAGQQRAGEAISMRAGVGTIIGSVLARQPDVAGGTAEQLFGGVTITVSDGDVERTVTTLTEGAVGTFAVPGLPIPGTYTVSASAPDYGEASLTVTLSGDQADAQFRLISQFATLRGMVVDPDGLPIPGAGVTLTTDEFTFSSNTVSDLGDGGTRLAGEFLVNGGVARLREATSFGSEPGEFLISDLPPGEYLVEIVHFAHKSYSVTVELQAGDDTFLPIDLAVREPYVGPTGSLTAFATDLRTESELGADEDVSFWLRRPGERFDPATSVQPLTGENKVSFSDLPLGSYILRSSAPDYFPKEILVNVGEDQTTQAEIKLRAYGSVVLYVYDPRSPDIALDGYEVAVQEVRTDGLNAQIIYGSIAPDGDGASAWTTEQTDDLRDGLWEIVVLKSPPGYLIESQGLSVGGADVDLTIPEMTFQVSSTSPSIIKVDLDASRYPTVKVRTFQPNLQDLANVSPLVDPSVKVQLECDDDVVIPAAALLTGDNQGVTGVYGVSNILLSEHPTVLTADSCQIVASGGGYGSSTAVLANALQVTKSELPLDPQISVVMLPPPVTITGRVAWFDGVESVFVPGAAIVSTDLVITGYPPTQAVGVSPDAPVAVQRTVDAKWDPEVINPAGTTPELPSFTLTGQAFGTSEYTVASLNIATGSFKLSVVMPPNAVPLNSPGNLTTGPVANPLDPPVIVPKSHDAITNTFDYDLTLTKPETGVLQGCLTVKTVRPVPKFLEIIEGIKASSAFGVSVPADDIKSDSSVVVAGCPPDDPGSGGEFVVQQQDFEVRPVDAGVWRVQYVLPADGSYQFDPSDPLDFVPVAVTNYDITANTATVTTAAAHDLAVGSTVRIVGTGDVEMDGDFVVASTPTTTTYTFAIAHPAVATTPVSATSTEVQSRRINPNETLNGFDRTVVENGTINLTIEPNSLPAGSAGNGPARVLDTEYTVTPWTGAPWAPVDIGSATSQEIRGVPVDARTPFSPVAGSLALEIPGYDVEGAQVTITSPLPPSSTSDDGADDIPFSVQAGQDVNITVDVDPFGRITGSLKGYRWRGEGYPGNYSTVNDFNQLTGITVQARSVVVSENVRVSPAIESLAGWFDLPTFGDPTTDPLTPDQPNNEIDFVLDGQPPGYYEFRVIPTAPVDAPVDYKLVGNTTTLDVEFPVPPVGRGQILTDLTPVYEMRNTETVSITDPFGLELAPATLDLHLWQLYDGSGDDGTPLMAPGTQLRVFRKSDNKQIDTNGAPVLTGDPVWSLANLSARQIQLQPDTYRLEIVDRDEFDYDQSFPAEFEVTLPSGSTPLERTLRVDAVLPPLNRQLHVRVKVINRLGLGAPLDNAASEHRLPVPAGVALERDWNRPDSYVAGTATPNTANLRLPSTLPETLKTCTLAEVQAAVPGCGEFDQTLLFDVIPSGPHQINVSVPEGYSFLPPASTQSDPCILGNVNALGSSVPHSAEGTDLEIDVECDSVEQMTWDLVLVADDVDVDVNILPADDDFPNPFTALYYGGSPVDVGTEGIGVVRTGTPSEIVRIRNLPPRRNDYALRLDDDLHHPNWNDTSEDPPVSAPVTFDADFDDDGALDPGQAEANEVDATMVAQFARLEATIRLENSPGACAASTADCVPLPDAAQGATQNWPTSPNEPAQPAEFRANGTEYSHTGGVAIVDLNSVGVLTSLAADNGVAYSRYANSSPPDVTLGKITETEVILKKLARINLQVTEPPDTAAGFTITPTLTPGSAPFELEHTAGETLWQYYVGLATTSIEFTVGADGLFSETKTVGSLQPGQDLPLLFTLGPRTVEVDVWATDGQQVTPNVEVRVPSTYVGACQVGGTISYCESLDRPVPVGSSAGNTTQFDFPDASEVTKRIIPNSGSAKVTVSAANYRTRTVTTGLPIRSEQVTVDLHPWVTVIGRLTSAAGTQIPTAVNQVSAQKIVGGAPVGPLILATTVAANGSFSFDDALDIGTWRIAASVVGWGAIVPVDVVVSEASADQVDLGSLTLVPRVIVATIDVQRPDTTAVSNWAAIDPAARVDEFHIRGVETGTATPVVRIRQATSVNTSIHLNLTTNPTSVNNGVVENDHGDVVLYESPDLSGLVRYSDGSNIGRGDEVTLYQGVCANQTETGWPIVDTENGSGTFTFPVSFFSSEPRLVFDPLVSGNSSYCLRNIGTQEGYLNVQMTVVGSEVKATASGGPSGQNAIIELGRPGISLAITAAPANVSAAGTLVTYTLRVTNTGDLPLTGLALEPDRSSDMADVTCPSTAPLLAGTSRDCQSTYTVRQADLDDGKLVVAVRPKTDQIDGAKVNFEHPLVQIKTVTVVGPSPLPTASTTGDVNFTYSVTNTGNIKLNGVVLSASNVNTAGYTCTLDLEPQQTKLCTTKHTVTQGELDAGTALQSTVSVTYSGATVFPSTVLSMYSITQNKAVTVTAASVTAASATGDIPFVFKVKNTGNVELSAFVVSATNIIAPTTPVACLASTLAPNAETTCTAQHTVNQAQLNSGAALQSTVTVTSAGVTLFGPTTLTMATITQNPSVAVAGPSTLPVATATGPVTFTYSVTNNGNITLTGMVVTADGIDAPTTLTCSASTLAPGSTATCTATHTVTVGELGSDLTSRVTVETDQNDFARTAALTMYKVATVPGAPASVTAAATATAGEIKVTWTAATQTGGSTILSYEVKIDGGQPHTVLAGAPYEYTYTSLSAGSHTATVTARNAVGSGAEGTASVTIS